MENKRKTENSCVGLASKQFDSSSIAFRDEQHDFGGISSQGPKIP